MRQVEQVLVQVHVAALDVQVTDPNGPVRMVEPFLVWRSVALGRRALAHP